MLLHCVVIVGDDECNAIHEGYECLPVVRINITICTYPNSTARYRAYVRHNSDISLLAARLPIVPVGTNRAASLPNISATILSSSFTVGSSLNTSSPTTASFMACLISGVGLVMVSLRRSTTLGLAILLLEIVQPQPYRIGPLTLEHSWTPDTRTLFLLAF